MLTLPRQVNIHLTGAAVDDRVGRCLLNDAEDTDGNEVST
jgi:hypothetical protein